MIKRFYSCKNIELSEKSTSLIIKLNFVPFVITRLKLIILFMLRLYAVIFAAGEFIYHILTHPHAKINTL